MKKTVTIQTPITKELGGATATEEIPLPPEEMWAELDNSGAVAPTPGAPDQPAVAAAPMPKREIATLDWCGDKQPTRDVPLEYAFTLDGVPVTSVRVRRLTVGELGDLIDSLPPQRTDNFDIYAAMTGLPAPVLRGLVDIDGEQVTGACYDFLPRVFRPVPTASTVSS